VDAILNNTWQEEPPEGYERAQVSFQLDVEDLELVNAVAGVLEISRAQVLRRLVAESLKSLEPYREDLIRG
jgi:hypothetical protein